MQVSILKEEIKDILEDLNTTVEIKLHAICHHLQSEIKHYDWVGFYFKNGDKDELKLSKFAGEPTEHTIIPYGKGICGQVAVSNQNFIVQDVTDQDNYISCGWQVKSEIVIPIFVDGKNVGQIDIDSHTKNSFSAKDTELLEFICEEVSKLDILPIVNKQ